MDALLRSSGFAKPKMLIYDKAAFLSPVFSPCSGRVVPMPYKILLNLVALSTVASSMLPLIFVTNVASATAAERSPRETVMGLLAPNSTSCDYPAVQSSTGHRLSQGILVASAQGISADNPLLDFSEAESDAAVTLFGCDCPACINTLRQVRTQPLQQGGQGHCWASLQQRVSPEEMQKVLETLDTEAAN